MTDTPQTTRVDLQDDVRNALSQNPHFLGPKIRFEVRDRDVVLSGVVDSYYHKQLAQETLRSVPGIGRIQNELEVSSRHPIS